jgi:opacity protein-like surface antigen
MTVRIGLLVAVLAVCLVSPAQSKVAPTSTGITMIKLVRSSCQGARPDYTLTLYSDGCAQLDGNSNFAMIGHFTGDTNDFADAAQAIGSHHFFDLRGEYPILKDNEMILDVSFATLSVTRNGITYWVRAMGNTGIPAQLRELFHIVDGIGLTTYWFNDDTGQPVATVHWGGAITSSDGRMSPCKS